MLSRFKTQLILIPVAALALLLTWDFGQRALMFARLSEIERQDQKALAAAQVTQTVLVAKKGVAQSDAYVERTARGWGWAKPGDTLVRTSSTPTPVPDSESRPSAPPASKSWLDQLRDWLGF